MCGIAGEVRFDRALADVAAVATMTDALERRGPDGSGLWASGPTALGHRRLAIIDLSRRGDQPMTDPDLGLTVVFNGCIYNHKELRADLERAGYRFFSGSDTEVLLRAYHHWGERFVDHLIGMFAFCLVERDSGRVVLGRDRLGIKPLYLAELPGRLRFSSSLPSLVAAGDVDTSIDPVGLSSYLSLHSVVPAPRTLLNGVRKLPPAHLLVLEPDGRSQTIEYWSPSFGADPARSDWSPADWTEAVSDALTLAVRRRLVADVPVGVLLSGGLDSSLIVGLLCREGQAGLQTFSIGFESAGGEAGDEFRWSDQVVERFGTDHHRMMVPTGDVLAALDGAVGAMSEPMVSHDVVAFYMLSAEVARHVKVVQSGQGADEVFAGYHWYQRMAGVDAPDGGFAEYRDAFFDRTPAEVADVVDDEYRLGLEETDPAGDFVRDHFALPGATTALERALRIDAHVMLVEDPVKRVDNMTMAWGLEARVPFLDHELVELAAACPSELKVAQGGKGILKDIAQGLLPADVIDRPKGYFPVPPLVHLDEQATGMLRDALLAPEVKQRGLFRAAHVEHLLAHPDELTTLKYNKLWTIGMVELWLQKHGI